MSHVTTVYVVALALAFWGLAYLGRRWRRWREEDEASRRQFERTVLPLAHPNCRCSIEVLAELERLSVDE